MSKLRLLWLIAFPMEALAGWLIINPGMGPIGAAIGAHLVATGVFGFSLVTWSKGRAIWAWALVGWTIALLGFPLMGMLATAVAFILTRVVFRRSLYNVEGIADATAMDDRPTNAVEAAHELEIALLDELEIEPIVDVLREDDPELKRAAIEAITKQRGADAVRLLIGLLHDPSQEARFFSSIGLSKLEDEYSRSILATQRTLAEAPDSTDAREQLAQLYLDYAVSGFLEGVTRDYYLELSRQTFEEALSTSPRPDELLYHLARVHLLLHDIAEAAALLDDLAARHPDDPAIPLLRMEAIYLFGDFRELVHYARRAIPHLAEDAETRDLVEWWAATGREALAVA